MKWRAHYPFVFSFLKCQHDIVLVFDLNGACIIEGINRGGGFRQIVQHTVSGSADKQRGCDDRKTTIGEQN